MKMATERARICHRADIERVRAAARLLEERVRGAWAKVTTTWSGDTLAFSYPLRNSSITGTISLKDGSIDIEVTGPSLLIAINKRKGLEVVTKYVRETLGEDVRRVEH